MAKVQDPTSRRVAVNVSLDLALLSRLDAVAEQEGLTRSQLLRDCVEQALEARDAGDEDWRYNDYRMLLAEYGPEDEGLYDDPEAMGATRVEW